MSYGVAVVTSIFVAVYYFFFEDAPPNPPSLSQSQVQANKLISFSYTKSLKNLFSNKSYVFLLIIYGVHIGAPVAISVLLNQLILSHYPDAFTHVGVIGSVMTCTGILGATIYGVFISKYGKLKFVTWLIYIFSTIASCLFVFLIGQGLIVVYILAVVASMFWNIIFCVGFELGVELTYPEPEAASGGLLTNSYQLFAIGMTYGFSYLYMYFGEFIGNLCFLVLLLFVDSLLFFIKYDLRRTEVDKLANQPSHVL